VFLLSSLQSLRDALVESYPLIGQDQVSAAESLYSPLRAYLPPEGVVSYLSDWQPPAPNPRDRYFHLAQYWLKPVILVREPGREWAISHFHGGAETGEAFRDLVLVKDFGNGLKVWRRRHP
jgi:hypothetical protein